MAKVTTRPPSLGAVIDQLWALREEKRRLATEMDELDSKISEVEQQVLDRLESEGLDKATGSKATVSISTSTVAQVEDWDAFWQFILKNKYTHLLQRRVSDPAYRELLEQGKKVPGVQPFIKRRVNLRTL